MTEALHDDTSAGALSVVRLLQNPLGDEAPPGERGDIVRVSDGDVRVYLLANEFDMATPTTLRWLLARHGVASPVAARAHDSGA